MIGKSLASFFIIFTMLSIFTVGKDAFNYLFPLMMASGVALILYFIWTM